MPTKFTDQSRQEWIQAYRQAYKQLDKAQCNLSALVNLLKSDGLNNDLIMDPSEREGLHNLLEDIATQIANALYEDMPVPDAFAGLCGMDADHE